VSRASAFLKGLLGLYSEPPDPQLLSFDQVQQLLRSTTPTRREMRMIRLDHVVGSVGRYQDFDRAFLPLNPAVRRHTEDIQRVMMGPTGVPPIEVYQLGDVYFVRDGNHRVAAALAQGMDAIEACVSEIPVKVPLEPDSDVDDLIIKVEHAEFLDATGLDVPDLVLTEPGRYRILMEHIDVHRYYLGLEQRRDVPLEEAARSWHDSVYQPVVEAIRESGVLREFPTRTEADLYLWVAWHRERLKEIHGDLPDARDVAASLGRDFSDRPVARFVKLVRRVARAALDAARSTPEPPDGSPGARQQ